MAIANSDGTIILSTKVDESGLKSWFASVNSSAKTAKANIAGIGTAANASAKTAKTAIAGVATALKALLPILISVQAIIKAIDFSKEAGKLATQTEASVWRLIDIYGSASNAVGDFIDQNARALGMSKSAAASFSSVYGNLFSAFADQETNAALTNEYLQMTAVVASKTGRTVEDVQERIRSGLLGNTEAIEDLGIFVNVKTIEMTDAFQRMAGGKSWEQLDAYTQQQIRAMAILEQSTAKYGDEVADTSATIRNEFNAAYQDFQNSWGAIVNQVLLPVLQVLTEIFNILTAGLNALSGRSGKILEDAETNADASKKTANNIKKQADNQKDLNDQMKKTLAGFDDIQILSAEIAEGEVSDPEGELPDLSGGDDGDYDPTEKINTRIAKIMKIASAGLIAIGLILLFLGLISWGLGFITAGAGLFSVQEAIPSGEGDVQSSCDAILAFLAGLVGYLITKALLTNWGKFVKLWGDFRALTQLMKTEGIGNTIKTLFGGSLGTMQLWAIAIGIIVGGIAYLALNWDKLSPAQRTITILGALAAAATTAAIAIALFHTSWSVGIAAAAIAGGIALLAGTYLFKKSNEKGESVKGAEGVAPASISQYEYLTEADTYSLPALAQGAVIPPNREFLAVLGDQRQGVNIEAPLQTIVDAFEGVLLKNGIWGKNKEVVLEINGREFGRAVIEQGSLESTRVGTSLMIKR